MFQKISKLPFPLALLLLSALSACTLAPDATPAPSSDPCATSYSPEACDLYRSQVRATVAANERNVIIDATRQADAAKVKATQAAADLQNAAVIAQAQATAKIIVAQAQADQAKANAQATLTASQTELMAAQARATATAIANNAKSTQAAIENNRQATLAAIDAQTAIDKATAERDTATATYYWNLVLGAVTLVAALIILGLAAYYGAMWIRRRGAEFRDDRGNKYLLIGTRLIVPALAARSSTSTNGTGDLSAEDAMLIKRRNQLVDLAHAGQLESDEDVIDGEYTSTPDQITPGPIGPENQLPAAPPFAQLLNSWQPSPAQVLLAYGAAGPIFGGINRLLSVKIIGMQGTGKTTLLRLIFVQCRLIGARAIAWDSHSDIVDDLIGVEAYMTAADILQSTAIVEHELDRRIAHRLHNEQRLLIMADEFELLADVCPETLHVVQRIVREGRKFGVYCLVTGKSLPAKLFGGSGTRDNFSSGYAFQAAPRQLQIAGFDREASREVGNLPAGYALLEGLGQPQIVAIPDVTSSDLKRILAASPAPSPTSRSGSRSGGAVVIEGETEVDNLKRDRVQQLLRDRTPASKIIADVWQVTGGDAYKKASAELSRIISTLISQPA